MLVVNCAATVARCGERPSGTAKHGSAISTIRENSAASPGVAVAERLGGRIAVKACTVRARILVLHMHHEVLCCATISNALGLNGFKLSGTAGAQRSK